MKSHILNNNNNKKNQLWSCALVKRKCLFVKARNSCIFPSEILVSYKTHLFEFFFNKQSLGTLLILMQICRKTTNTNLGIIIWIATKILVCIYNFGIAAQVRAENCILVLYCSFELKSLVCSREQWFLLLQSVWDLLINWKSWLVLRDYETICKLLKLPSVSNYAEQRRKKKENTHTGIYKQKNIFDWKFPLCSLKIILNKITS